MRVMVNGSSSSWVKVSSVVLDKMLCMLVSSHTALAERHAPPRTRLVESYRDQCWGHYSS